MPRPNRKTVRVSSNIPEVIIVEWERLLRLENEFLPLLNRSQRLELAILEHIRVLRRRLGELDPQGPQGPEGQGGRRRALGPDPDRPDGPNEETDDERHYHIEDREEAYSTTRYGT